ncbi:MAG: hypothetical protein KGJ40_00820 [candidate division NC10 bacterium]|nr:hypothetical protein [candidate division NC10 bacterium]MDE2485623.1 hypothetical protein [candidate division NC10 bacterium]
MKSIKDTFETIRGIINALPVKVNIAVVGGYAVILHGVERTTLDVDFCLYSDLIRASGADAFFALLKRHLPERFRAELVQGSTTPEDSFKHDAIFLEDLSGEYPRMDLLIARYKWELEAIKRAEHLPGVSVPVLTKPYLAAMKLQATGLKDADDAANLIRLMTEEEKATTFQLAERTGRDRKLARLLAPLEEEVREIPEELL